MKEPLPDRLLMADLERAIGRLEASDESSQRQRAELFKQVGELREDMHKGFQKIHELLAPLPLHIKSHCDDLDALSERAKVFQSWIDKAKGASWATKLAVGIALVVVPGAFSYGVYVAAVAPLKQELKQEIETLDRRQKAYFPRSLVGPQ